MEKLNYYSGKNIHTLIPVKAKSNRCPGKNKVLLPYTQSWLERVGLKSCSTIITDDPEEFEEELYGWDYFWEKKTSGDDILSLSHYPYLDKSDLIFYFPVTQPFRDLDLVQRMIEAIEENPGVDFITTYTEIQDRSIFYLNSDATGFQDSIELCERKGSLCPKRLMIDGSGYLIKRKFLESLPKEKELINSYFWNGKFRGIENKSFLVDVDTPKDLRLFNKLKNYDNT